MERLVGVWMHPALVERLRGGVRCSRVVLVEGADGTFVFGLDVRLSEARTWGFPVSADVGGGELLVLGDG